VISGDPFDQRVAARLFEYWAWFTPWHRRLWNVGTLASLNELLEAAEATPGKGLKALQREISQLVGPDPAVGDRETKQMLAQLLKGDLTYRRDGWYKLAQMMPRIESGYLSRWADLIRSPPKPGAERVARSVAGHLLWAGFSSTYLHRWLQYQVKHRTETLSIADALEEADRQLLQTPTREFRVIVPILAAPGMGAAQPPEWRTAAQIASLIETIQGSRPGLRQSGGFVLTVKSRDHFAAVEKARDLVDRWDARAELSTGKRLRRLEGAWVEGISAPIPFVPLRREVDIGALELENKIYSSLHDDEMSLRIDDALQLLQPMPAGSISAAISGGWAAIEALLAEGDTRGAQRLASIVACSYPRAELTTLSYFHAENGSDTLAKELQRETQNLKRARMVANAVEARQTLAGRGPQDDAAYDRMREVLAHPRETLAKVRDYVGSALHRLYRQRNITLHGGRVSGAARTETLWTAPHLVGAGLDRVVHAWFAEGTRPLELAARAELNLELVGAPSGPHPTELLEPR
jgi:hypothetical protein